MDNLSSDCTTGPAEQKLSVLMPQSKICWEIFDLIFDFLSSWKVPFVNYSHIMAFKNNLYYIIRNGSKIFLCLFIWLFCQKFFDFFCGVLCVVSKMFKIFVFMLLDICRGKKQVTKEPRFYNSNSVYDVLIVFNLLFHYFSVYLSYDDSRYSNHYCAGKVFNGISLFLVFTEFIVALTSVVFTCLFACCGANGYYETPEEVM